MLFQERLLKILEILDNKGTVKNSDLVRLLSISEATIRRDLDYLEKQKKIKRVRGGAVLQRLENKIEKREATLKEKEDKSLEAKKYIASLASNFLKEGEYIYLDAGTTTNQLIDYIKEKKIKVVTNGIMHLEKLLEYGIETYLLGGYLKIKTQAIVGAKALDNLSNFSFDKAFIGANGINDKECTTHDIEEALLKRKAIEKANESFILVDSTKFGVTHFSKIINLEKITIITDKNDVDKEVFKNINIINK